jgi:hypothetical protein
MGWNHQQTTPTDFHTNQLTGRLPPRHQFRAQPPVVLYFSPTGIRVLNPQLYPRSTSQSEKWRQSSWRPHLYICWYCELLWLMLPGIVQLRWTVRYRVIEVRGGCVSITWRFPPLHLPKHLHSVPCRPAREWDSAGIASPDAAVECALRRARHLWWR